MAKVTFKGLGRWDGEYDLDVSRFTNRELHTVKQISGVRAGELQDALTAGDNDVLVAMAVIAAHRAGQPIPVEVIWEADAGKIAFDFTEDLEAADAGPPEVKPPASAADASVKTGPSGSDSESDGAPPPSLPSPIGSRG